MTKSLDSFKARKTLKVGDKTYTYFSIPEAEKNGLEGVSRLPYSLKVVLENLLRFEDGRRVTRRGAHEELARRGLAVDVIARRL